MIIKYKNKNSEKTKKNIFLAFIELGKTKDFSKISVTDLCKQADIHRTTFYNHYSDVYDIIEDIETNIINEIKEILTDTHYDDFLENPIPGLIRFNEYLLNDLEIFKILIKQSESEIFLSKLRHIFKSIMLTNNNIDNNIRNSIQFELLISFFAGGITTLYKEWLSDEITCDINEIPKMVSSLLKQKIM